METREYDDNEGIGLVELQRGVAIGLKYIFKWWWIFATLTMAGFITGGAWAYNTSEVYEAQAMLYADQALADTVVQLAWSPAVTREITAGWGLKPTSSGKSRIVTLVTQSSNPESATIAVGQWTKAMMHQKLEVKVLTEPVMPTRAVPQRRGLLITGFGLFGLLVAIAVVLLVEFGGGVWAAYRKMREDEH